MAAQADQPAAVDEAAKPSSEPSPEGRRKAEVERQIKDVDAKIAATQARLDTVNADLGDVDAQAVAKRHIKLLHQYNELKDIATGLFGLIAERRGVRVRDLYEEFGVDEDD